MIEESPSAALLALTRRCIHCGMCLPSCPTYDVFHTEMDAPRGRIVLAQALAEGRVPATDRSLRPHLDRCLACRACEVVCPSGVQYGAIVDLARAQIAAARRPGRAERLLRWLVLGRLVPARAPLRAAAAGLWLYQRSGLQRLARRLHLLPTGLGGLEALLPPLRLAWAATNAAVRASAAGGEGADSGAFQRRSPWPCVRPLRPIAVTRPSGDWKSLQRLQSLPSQALFPVAAGRLRKRCRGFNRRDRGLVETDGRQDSPLRKRVVCPQSETQAPTPPARPRVAFFSGCVQDAFLSEVNRATVSVLQKHGYTVVIPPGQTCCGALHGHLAEHALACDLARRNIRAFAEAGVEAIVVNAGGCGAHLKTYGELLAGDPEYVAAAAAFARQVFDLSEFLVAHPRDAGAGQPPAPRVPETAQNTAADPHVAGRAASRGGIAAHGFRVFRAVSRRFRAPNTPNTPPLRVTYADSCHLRNAQHVVDAPRQLLRGLAGVEYVELEAADRCCGSAGVYNIVHPDIAGQVLQAKVANILKTGADVVITTNSGCHFQIQAGLAAVAPRVRVMHLAELLDQYDGGADGAG